MEGKIVKVSGPLIVAEGMGDAEMFDVVRVSEHKLIGEIIELRGDKASIQVYEETSGIGPGGPVYSTGSPLSVELGPGLIEAIFDGIQRPLDKIYALGTSRIERGVEVAALDREKVWEFLPIAKAGDKGIGRWDTSENEPWLTIYIGLVAMTAAQSLSAAIAAPGAPGSLLLGLGGLLFFLSDIVLGIWNYQKNHILVANLNWLLYFSGQFLLCAGYIAAA